ncbi:MAG: IS200/IS605 family transposase [Anaerolineae bacterium]|jgi:putative transposase|nr:IS200/IS605 family transposase [Anaerolineae bacterium]
MPYWKCYYHLVWTTKYREPAILPPYEPVIFEAIKQKAQELKCAVLAVNGVDDHVHVAITIAPAVAVATCVGSLKGASSRAVNTNFERERRFHWQEGYGVLSFGEKALAAVIDYVERQKEHHARQALNRHLERVDD